MPRIVYMFLLGLFSIILYFRFSDHCPMYIKVINHSTLKHFVAVIANPLGASFSAPMQISFTHLHGECKANPQHFKTFGY